MMMMMMAMTSGMSHLWLRRTKRKLPVCTVSCFHFPLCCQRHISQSGRQSGNVALTTPQLKSEIATMGIPFQHAAKQKSIKSIDFWQLPAHCNCSYEWNKKSTKTFRSVFTGYCVCTSDCAFIRLLLFAIECVFVFKVSEDVTSCYADVFNCDFRMCIRLPKEKRTPHLQRRLTSKIHHASSTSKSS